MPETKLHQFTVGDFEISLFHSLGDQSQEWNSQIRSDIFLHNTFLEALEQTPPSGVKPYYAIVKRNKKPVGIAYFQVIKIKLDENLRLHAFKPSGFVKRVGYYVKKLLAAQIKANVLVGGNVALTGCHGFKFNDQLTEREWSKIYQPILEQTIKYLKSTGTRISATLVKDFYLKRGCPVDEETFTEFKVQPSMIFKLDSAWTSFDDYLSAMRSKYRVRVRRARKKAADIIRKELTLADIKAAETQIHALYLNVIEQANFNLFELPPDYFYSLKQHLGDNMKVIGYFQNEELTGFSTAIKNDNKLDAHFLGYDPKCNSECQLYLNMLYDLVESAIDWRMEKLMLSRTAMEIKSSVGAESYEMKLFLKLENGFFNKLLPRALAYFTPDVDWQPRSPFK